ncbi:MAG: hypothetical protein Sapg2KO_33300 [Saprospiraceae bacterium]
MKPIFNKRMNKLINSTLVICLLSLCTCLDQIDLEIPKGFDDALAIQGILVKSNPSYFELTVSRLFDFTPESADQVNVREVILTDEAGNSVEIERTGTGLYRTTFDENNSDIEIEIGKSYKINFRTFDDRSFESTLEPLVAAPKIDTITYETINKQFVFTDGITTFQDSAVQYNLNTSLQDPTTGEKRSVLWNIFRVYQLTDPFKTCYITQEIEVTDVKVFDGFGSSLPSLENYNLHQDRFSSFYAEAMYFEVIQSGLSEGAFRYWNETNQVLERDGNMFEAPAGKVFSNFYNINDPDELVFGYFYATTQDTARIYVAPEVVNNPNSICNPPPSTGPNEPPPQCGNCLILETSTTVKPDYWIE